MIKIGAYEAKIHLPKLLERVKNGEHLIITKHGMEVAVLIPPKVFKRINPGKVIAELRKFRLKNNLKGVSIHNMINEGRD